MSLDSKHVSDSKTLHEFEIRGKEQFESFKQRMCDEQLDSTIKKNNFEIFQPTHIKKKISLPNRQKQNCSFFEYIHCVPNSQA